MFDHVRCPQCRATDHLHINLGNESLVCLNCDGEFNQLDLHSHASEYLRIAFMLERMPIFEKSLVETQVMARGLTNGAG